MRKHFLILGAILGLHFIGFLTGRYSPQNPGGYLIILIAVLAIVNIPYLLLKK